MHACILLLVQSLCARHGCAQSWLKPQIKESNADYRVQKLHGSRGKSRHDSSASENDSLISVERYYLGLSCLLDARIRKAGKQFKDALDSEFARKNTLFREKCLSKLALVLENQHHIAEAEEACLTSASMAEARGDSTSMMYYLLALYKAERKEGNSKRAPGDLERLSAYFKRNHWQLAEIACQQELAACCLKIGDKAGFESHILEAELSCRKLESPQVTAFVNLVKVEGLLKFGDCHAALGLIRESLELCRQHNFPELYAAFGVLEAEYLVKTNAPHNEISLSFDAALARAQSMGLDRLCASVKLRQMELADSSVSEDKMIMPGDLLSGLDYFETSLISDELKQIRDKSDAEVSSVFGRPALASVISVWLLLLFSSIFASVLSLQLGNIVPGLSGDSSGVAVPDNDEDEKLLNLYQAILERMETEKPFLDMNFSISSLGVLMNRSERYLSLAINKAGKTNFNRLVIRFRVDEACSLIRKYEKSITMNEVAEMSGFANRMSFTRRFKEITGMSPTEYLDNIQVK